MENWFIQLWYPKRSLRTILQSCDSLLLASNVFQKYFRNIQLKPLELLNKIHTYMLGKIVPNFCVGISKGLKDKLELLQRRAHRIICGSGCECTNFTNISERINIIGRRMLERMSNPSHPCNHLLPYTRSNRLACHVSIRHVTGRHSYLLLSYMCKIACSIKVQFLSQVQFLLLLFYSHVDNVIFI